MKPLPRPDPARPPLTRAGLAILQAGLVVSSVAFVGGGATNAERFSHPKEVALHVCGLLAAMLCLAGARRVRADVVDVLLAAFLALGILSAAVAATNPWYALRAISLTASGVAVFWTARSLAGEGLGRPLLAAAAVAVALTAAGALLEAYGAFDLSMAGRAPGGTFGNRNRMGHFLALGLPTLLLLAATVRRRTRLALLWPALAGVAAALVLSRSRAAWLAVAVAALLAAGALLAGRKGLRGALPRGRAALLGLAVVAGCAAAVVLPNDLRWRSQSPYLETLQRLVDYESGSGRARVIQYAATLRMTGRHALLGVGPGQWTIEYPRYASQRDPSFTPFARVPTNRLPHGDWIGIAAERGWPALLLLAAALGVLVLRTVRTIPESEDGAGVLHGAALLATVTALGVIGTFDPALLTPAPTFLLFVVLGALAPPRKELVALPFTGTARAATIAVVLLLAPRPIVYSFRQLWAGRYTDGSSISTLTRATRLNPGDYYAHLLLAEAFIRKERCDLATPHLVSAFKLFPTALAPVRLMVRCQPSLQQQQEAPRLELPPPPAPALPTR